MALRVGTEDKKKVYSAAGLGALMLVLLIRFLWQTFGPSTPPPQPPAMAETPRVNTATTPSAATANSAAPYAHSARKVASASALDPTLHPELMAEAEALEYTGSGRNIFSQFSAPPAIPTPITPVRTTQNTEPPPPPPPPPINLRFYGYAAERDGHKQVFLLQGDDIFIASEGDVVDRRYRVGKIGTVSVQVEDLPYHNTQTLPLQQ
jgi:hypothetical protein